jgi:hypothetical protein
MFTVGNTLFGAVASAVLALLAGWVPFLPPTLVPICVLGHVWFLLGHLHLRRLAREGKSAEWSPLP